MKEWDEILQRDPILNFDERPDQRLVADDTAIKSNKPAWGIQ